MENSLIMKSANKVVVGLSGGVDSSVAAALLKQAGYEVLGIFMKNWEEDDDLETGFCSAAQDLNDARKVADVLGIEFAAVNFSYEYWERVFEYFLAEYKAGRTPNPDVLCNKEIKFKAFLEHARLAWGAQCIATGHYARLDQSRGLLKGRDLGKDQSYFLNAVPMETFSQVLFPIGHLLKTEVREMARDFGLVTAEKKDSTGICFIGERKFKSFLQNYLPAQPGLIQDIDRSKTMGSHEGLMYYTLGQRHGLNIGGSRASSGQPWYVVEKDLQNNILWVAQGKDHPRLFKKYLKAVNMNWLNDAFKARLDRGDLVSCTAKIRYRQVDQPCEVQWSASEDQWLVTFKTLQRSVTPGQYVVFYEGDLCLGGAIIHDL